MKTHVYGPAKFMCIGCAGLFLLFPLFSWGEVDFLRLSWRDDPSTTMVIGWNQVGGSDPEVRYDTEDHGRKASAYRMHQPPDRVVDYREMNNHFVRLENLKSDTAYYFVISDSHGVSRRFWFSTAPDTPKPFTFIAGGDSRSQPKFRREGNRLVAKLRPLFILFGGDYTGSGTPEEWDSWFTDWQLTISEDGRLYPIIATHGNHENKDMQMMDKLFDTPHPDQYDSIGFAGDLMRIWGLNSELEYKDKPRPQSNRLGSNPISRAIQTLDGRWRPIIVRCGRIPLVNQRGKVVLLHGRTYSMRKGWTS